MDEAISLDVSGAARLSRSTLAPLHTREMGLHRLEIYLDGDARLPAFSRDLRMGLSSTPKRVPTKWLYDEKGGTLFGAITRADDYYLSRAEAEILSTHLQGMAAIATANTFVDLGSGFSERSASILNALAQRGQLDAYMPFEIDAVTLTQTADAVARRFPGAAVLAIVGDFDQHLSAISHSSRQLVGLMGQTFGNFSPAERQLFLRSLHGALKPNDTFMIGIDLIKDVERLKRAYNDSDGATAAFVFNILESVNDVFGATFRRQNFTYCSEWNERDAAVEMMLRSNIDHSVEVSGLDMTVNFSRGENLYVGRSRKFEREKLKHELAGGGFRMDAFLSDRRGDYAVVLAGRI